MNYLSTYSFTLPISSHRPWAHENGQNGGERERPATFFNKKKKKSTPSREAAVNAGLALIGKRRKGLPSQRSMVVGGEEAQKCSGIGERIFMLLLNILETPLYLQYGQDNFVV